MNTSEKMQLSAIGAIPIVRPLRAERQVAALWVDSSSSESRLLGKEWGDLAERLHAMPYLRPEWAAAWWQAFGIGEVRVLTLRRHGRLVGILPMACRRGRLASLTNFHTPRSGVLAEDAGAAEELVRALFALRPRRISLDGLLLQGVDMRACQQVAEECGYRVWLHPYQRSPYIDIEGSWDEYLARLHRRHKTGLRRHLRHLSALGKVSLDVVHGPERLDAALDEAFDIEALGWKKTCRTAIRSHPQTLRFYRDIGQWGAACGSLRLFFLRLDRRPLAMLYALVDQGVCHLLKTGYDPQFQQFSPGILLMHEVIRQCISAGLRTVEFHGDAERYKMSWATGTHELVRFDAFSPAVTGRLSWAVQVRARQTAKYLLRGRRKAVSQSRQGD